MGAQIERYGRRERRGRLDPSMPVLLCAVNQRGRRGKNILNLLRQRLNLEMPQCRVVLVRTRVVMRRRTIWMFMTGTPAPGLAGAVMNFLHGR